MKWKVKYLIYVFILLLFITSVSAYSIDKFVNKSSIFHIDMLEKSNITLALDIPYFAYLDNLTFNISAYSNVKWIYQENADLNITSNWLNSTKLFDGDYSTGTERTGIGSATATINYTIPGNITGSTINASYWTVKDDCGTVNLTIPSAVFIRNGSYAKMIRLEVSLSDTAQAKWYAYIGSQAISLRQCNSNTYIYEESIHWSYLPETTNISIEIGQPDSKPEYSRVGEINASDIISVNITQFNEFITNDCTEGIKTGDYCRLPLYIYSGTNGTVKIHDLYSELYATVDLIDESTGNLFDISNIENAKLYADEEGGYYDYKTKGTNSVNMSMLNNSLRLELINADDVVITRYIDLTLTPRITRVCANVNDTTHYEQLIISASQKPVRMNSIFADCLIVADYTRFAYQEGKSLLAYSTPRQYELITWVENDTPQILAGIDGIIESIINLDILEFQAESYELSILGDTLQVTRNSDDPTLLELYYLNYKEDNTYIKLEIENTVNDQIVYTKDDFTNYNEWTVLFSYSTLANVTNTTIFKATVTKTNPQGTSTITEYFNIMAESGSWQAGFALVLSIIVFVFGFTMVIPRLAFSFFGIFIELIAIIILSFAAPAWYITFIGTVEIIILVFTIIMLTYQTYPTVSG